MRYLAIAMVLALTSCARLSVDKFDHAGASQEQVEKDYAACEFEIIKHGEPDSNTQFNHELVPCMRSKGYRKN